MNPTSLIFKNTAFQTLGKAVTVCSSLILTWFIRGKLQNDGFGIYIFVSAFVLFFGNIADWGTSLISVREASKTKDKKTVFSTTLILRFILSLGAFVLVNIVIRANPEWRSFVFPTTIASLVLIFLSLKTSINIIFQTAIRLGVSTLIEVVFSLLFLVLGVLTILWGLGVNGIFASWVISTALVVLISIFFAPTLLSFSNWDTKTASHLIKESLPTGVLLIVFSVYNRVDIIILQHFWGIRDVGIYGLPYKIYETLVVVAAYIMNTTYPLLSQNKNTSNFKLIFQKSFDILTGTSLLLLLLTLLLAPTITVLWGTSALMSVAPLRILSFAIFFSYLNHLTGYSLIALGRQTVSLLIGVFALFINIVSNWILIPHYSYIVASWMTVVTEGFVFVVSGTYLFKRLGYLPSFFSFPKTIYSLVFKK